MNFISSLRILLLWSVALTSCTGQDKTQGPVYITAGSKEIPNEDFVPLFYEGQICHWVRDIFEDSRGNLWLATNHYGLVRYDGDTLVYLSEKIGVGNTRVSGIVEDTVGNLWFAISGGLMKYDPNNSAEPFTIYSESSGLNNTEIWCITLCKDGTILVGTTAGASRYDGQAFTAIPLPKADSTNTTYNIAPDRVSSILEDVNGTIWYGTDGSGIYRFDGKIFQHFTVDDGLCDNNISGLLQDKKGNIWISTMHGGLGMYDGNTFTNFTQNGNISGEEVAGLYEDRNANIWFGVEHNGVYRYDGSTFTHFNEIDGLDASGIISILEDSKGRFWFGGWKGLFRYDGTKFVHVTKDGPWK